MASGENSLWDDLKHPVSGILNDPPVAPSNVRLVSYDHQVVDSFYLEKLERSSTTYLECDGKNITWSISPTLPDGLKLEISSKPSISGVVSVAVPPTVFTVTAKNEVGEAYTTFTLTVVGCQYGTFLYPKSWGFGKYYLEVLNDGKTLYNSTIGSTEYHSMCIPKGSYSYRAKCTNAAYGSCYMGIEDESGAMLFNNVFDKEIEGTFNMVVTGPPLISFRPLIAYPVKKTLTYMIMISGTCSELTITPPLEDFTLNDLYVLRGSTKKQGLTPFTITAVNEKGTTTFASILAIDMCPEGTELLSFKTFTLSQTDTVRFYDSSSSLIFDFLDQYDTTINVNACVKEGEYWIDYHKRFEPFMNPLYILHNNQIIATYDGATQQTKQRRFSISHPIHEQSSMKFTTSVSGDWSSVKYKDDKWKDGSSGKWGSFSSSNPSVYFRKEFEVSNPDSFSFLHLDLMASDVATVYLNGEYLTQITSALNLTRSVFTNEKLLKKGKNVLAIEMKAINPASSSAIAFDIQLVLASSDCLMTSYGGTATDGSQGSTSIIKALFNPFMGASWDLSSFPVVATYTYPFNARHPASHMKMAFDKRSKPIRFHINGLDNGKKVLIFTQKDSTPVSLDGYATFPLDVPGVYSGYEIVIDESYKNNTLTLRDIRFFSCNPLVCKKQWGVDEGGVGTVVYKKCPLFKTGAKQLTCEIMENEGEWIEDDSACLQKYSMSTYTFIDWSVEISNFTAVNRDSVLTAFKITVENNLTISFDEIEIYLERDLSTTALNRIRYDVRFTVESEIGDYIYKNMPALITDLNKLVRSSISLREPDLSVKVVSYPTIHNPPDGSGVLSVILIVVAAICIIDDIHLRCVRRRRDQVKSLKKSTRKGGDNEALLEEIVS